MCNSDEGMFDCCATPNQYIKVGNGNRLPILKKGMKKCVIIQKNGKKIAVTLHNVYHIPQLWYNLFSLMEALKHGWKLENKGMYITLTSQSKYIKFNRIFKCPTGHLNGVQIQNGVEFSMSKRKGETKKGFKDN